MGILRKSILATFILLTANFLNAQTAEQIQVFENTYTYETNGEYSKAIQELKQVYDENSYPINLRLAWLNYSSGLFTESMAYNTKASALMPYSVEAPFGLVYPASAQGYAPAFTVKI